MIATIRKNPLGFGAHAPFLAALLVTAFGMAMPAGAATTTLVDVGGFEANPSNPANGYKTTFDGDGKLEGQSFTPISPNGQWQKSFDPGGSTATIQDAVAASGSQSVRLDRAPNSDIAWGIDLGSGLPATERFICIEWDMRVDQTVPPSGAFAPLFGVEAVDNDGLVSGVPTIGLLGSLLVDSFSGDVLYQAPGTGFLEETGTAVALAAWNSFRIVLDFQDNEYSVFANNTLLATTGFVDTVPTINFTDADLSTVPGFGDSVSRNLTGTAYFDNFFIYETHTNKVPEPTSLALLAGMLGVALAARRKGSRA